MDTSGLLQCLNEIVGVANNASGAICQWANVPGDVQTASSASTSSLFIDQLPGGVDINRIEDASVLTKLLRMGIEAREQAIKDFKDGLSVAIGNRYTNGKKNFVGLIGKLSISSTLASSKDLQAIRIQPVEAISALIKLSKIQIAVNGTGTFNVYVGRLEKGATMIEEIVEVFPVTSVANSWTNVPMGGVPQLPMVINGIEQEYVVYWSRTESGGLSPKENEIRCNCPGEVINALLDYVAVTGAQFSDVNVYSNLSIDNTGRGMSLTVDVRCNSDMIICREFDASDAIAVAIARGVWHRAGELWIEKIFKAGDVTRELIQNREYLWGKRNHYRAEYEARVIYVADHAKLDDTNCFVCRDPKMFYAGILS